MYSQLWNRKSIVTETINTSSSSLISNGVNAHNDEWWPWYNCSDLAIDIWNSISEEKIDRDWIQTPTNLMDKIRGFDDYKIDRNYFGDPNRVGYFADDEFYYEL